MTSRLTDDIRIGAMAGALAGAVSGLPSTVAAVWSRRSVWESTRAAGSVLTGRARSPRAELAAGALAHGALSVAWGIVLASVLPRRGGRARGAVAGALAGAAVAAFDLGLVGHRIPAIRALPLGPQVADHVLYGAVVGAVASGHRTRAPCK